ncbi:unnamed protein product, partial [Iphiclides podalirius]
MPQPINHFGGNDEIESLSRVVTRARPTIKQTVGRLVAGVDRRAIHSPDDELPGRDLTPSARKHLPAVSTRSRFLRTAPGLRRVPDQAGGVATAIARALLDLNPVTKYVLFYARATMDLSVLTFDCGALSAHSSLPPKYLR